MRRPARPDGHRHAAVGPPSRPVTDSAELRRVVRELWLSAAALGALAFVLRLAVLFWLQPVAWAMSTSLGMLTMLGGTVVAAGAPVAAFALLARRYPRLPRTFLRRERPAPAVLERFAAVLDRVASVGRSPAVRTARRTFARGGRALRRRLAPARAAARRAARPIKAHAATLPAGHRALALASSGRARLRRTLAGRRGGAHAADTAHRTRHGGAHAAPDGAPMAFVAPATPWLGLYAVMGMAVAAGAVVTTRTGTDQVDIGVAGWLPALVLVEAVLSIAVWFALRGPAFALTANGIVVRRLWSGPNGRLVPWDALAVDHVPVPSQRAWQVRLPVRTHHGGPDSVAVTVGWLWVNPVFALAAISHYVTQPEHRAAIGTRAELDRLQQAVAAAGQRATATAAPGTP